MNPHTKRAHVSHLGTEGASAHYGVGVKGFTLVEILLVVVILTILVGLGLPISLDFYKSQQLDSHAQGIIQTLRRAQLKAMSIENDSSFGVYLTNDNYTLFKGSSFETRDIPYDEVFDLPQILTVTGIQEIVFSKFEGIPNTIGNIFLRSNDNGRTISINKFGTVSFMPTPLSLPPYAIQLHYRWRNDDGGE